MATHKTLLGFDFGLKRIGVAVGQTQTNTARPLTQINSIDWDTLTKLITEWKPHELVVGLPINMDDSDSLIAQQARSFAKQLTQRFNLPAHLYDERLTTRAALEHLKDRGNNKPSKAEINSMAAAIILESWLNDTI